MKQLVDNVKKWTGFRKKSERKLKKDDITIVDTTAAKKAVVATALEPVECDGVV